MNRSTVAAVVVGLVVFLWLGGRHGFAVLVVLVGLVLWVGDVAVNEETKCWCDHGKVWSRLTSTFRRHKACGATGFRRRFARRVFDKRGK